MYVCTSFYHFKISPFPVNFQLKWTPLSSKFSNKLYLLKSGTDLVILPILRWTSSFCQYKNEPSYFGSIKMSLFFFWYFQNDHLILKIYNFAPVILQIYTRPPHFAYFERKSVIFQFSKMNFHYFAKLLHEPLHFKSVEIDPTTQQILEWTLLVYKFYSLLPNFIILKINSFFFKFPKLNPFFCKFSNNEPPHFEI